MIELTNVIVNDELFELITNKHEDYFIIGESDKKDDMEKNLQSTKEDSYDDILVERKDMSSRVKKNHLIDNVIGNLDEEVTKREKKEHVIYVQMISNVCFI